MRIRPATHHDTPSIAAVQTASWKDTYKRMLPDGYLENDVSDDLVRHWGAVEVRPEDVVLVAEEDGIIGFIAIWCRPDPFIDNLHVLPHWRSKGVGKELLEAAAEQLTRQGQSKAYLWVLEDNHRAVQFYEGLGGVREERANKPVFGYQLPSLKIAAPRRDKWNP